ncbi:hypothetical protein HMPREF1861_00311 [Corynebacterium kroppenstedtii]|nr:hypothetical protein HMPREF1861_00311 [Corynebacterium kroppenstedtii]
MCGTVQVPATLAGHDDRPRWKPCRGGCDESGEWHPHRDPPMSLG